MKTKNDKTTVREAKLACRCMRLVAIIRSAIDVLDGLSKHRKLAHEYDRDMGTNPRLFVDDDDWDIAEGIARGACRDAKSALRAELGGRP
jgi:hypothetical protein